MADVELISDGADYTADELRYRAADVRGDTLPGDRTTLTTIVLLEALAKTKDDLDEAVRLLTSTAGSLVTSLELTAQLRKEFEALKSSIARERR